MRTGLTQIQSNILDAAVKERTWLIEVDVGNTGTIDYYWSTKNYTFEGQSYEGKPIEWTPITMSRGLSESNILPKAETTISIPCNNDTIDGHYASYFKGASIKMRLIMKADLWINPETNQIQFDTGNWTPEATDEQEEEILSFVFDVVNTDCVYGVQKWQCKDFFQKYTDGVFPDNRLVSDLFPADIMKDDTVCVPMILGTGYFPVRWAQKWLDVIYIDADTFTISGDYTSLFASGYWLRAYCGVDGNKSCWVDTSSYDAGAGLTTVNLTSGSDDLTSNLDQVSVNFYVIGESGPTYTIDRSRVPQEANGVTEFLNKDIYPASSPNYTFKIDTVTGSDGNSYSVVRQIIHDANEDGTNDANGLWGVWGKEIYDVPMKISRSDTLSITNPASQIEYLLEAFGVPSAQIDDTSKTIAESVYTGRDFSLNIPLWYQMERLKLLCKIFALSGMIPIIRDKVYFKVLTKTSQLAIEKSLVIKGSFKINTTSTEQKDSGYIIWQKSTLPIGQGNEQKNLIACKSSMATPADVTIECEWVYDDTGVKAQKAGKLALQRKILPSSTISFSAPARILKLEPGDVITINRDDHGAEGSGYNVMIDKMVIHRNCLVDLTCTRFSDSLDDWDDLTASSITIGDADTTNAYTPVLQGPVDADGDTDGFSNAITQTILVGSGGVVKTNIDPATNGGLLMSNTQLIGYNSSGDVRFQVDYGGVNQGDVKIGDYDNDNGLMWDQSASLLSIKGGDIKVESGGNYVQLNSSGLVGYDSVLGMTFKIPTNGDTPEFSSGIVKETTIQMYTSGIIKTNSDPATNGGLLINSSSLTGYNSSGDVRFQVIYNGTNEGDVKWGDYDNGNGFFYDQNAGKSYYKTGAAGGIEISGGGDITLEGSDTDPGLVKFNGTSYTVEMGCDADGNRFAITPTTDEVTDFIIGDAEYDYWYDERKFKNISITSHYRTILQSGPKPLGYPSGVCGIMLDPYNAVNPLVKIIVQQPSVGVVAANYGFYSDKLYYQTKTSGYLYFKPMIYSLSDDGTTSLPDATDGFVFVNCGGECGMWNIESDGTVTKISGSANTAATDSDTNLCVYQSGTTAIVKNRLGATYKTLIMYYYHEYGP